MNVLQIQILIKKLEPTIVIFLLLVSSEVDWPFSIEPVVRLLRYALITFLCLRISVHKLPQLAYAATRDLFPWLLVGMSLLSVFWSVVPTKTIDEVAPLIRDSCFGFYIAVQYTPKRQIRLFAWVFGIAGVLSLLAALVIPSYGISFTFAGAPALTGIYKHKQYVGRLMPIGAISFLNIALEARRLRWLAWTGFLLMLSLIWLSYSKSSIVLLLSAICFLPVYQLVRQKYKLKATITVFLLLFLLITIFVVVSNLETLIVDILGKNMELTGRLPIWTLAIEKGLEKPWLGYGYAGFWTSDHALLVIKNTFLISLYRNGTRLHAHNTYVDVFLQLGLIGLCCLVFSIVRLIWRTIYLINKTKRREFTWILQVLIVVLISSWTESDALVHRDIMWISYVSISFSVALLFYQVTKSKSSTKTL